MNVTISTFGGILPRVDDHRIGATHASIAHDVKLRNGRLEPWREKAPVSKTPDGTRTIYMDGCCTLAWPSLVDVASLNDDWPHLYITGRNCYPEMAAVCKSNGNCSVTYSRLGVPAPPSAPFASAAETCDRSSDARSYVYTYVNVWGDESAPSPPSNIVTVADGTPVSVTGFSFPPDGYNIEHINVYRSATGFRETNAKVQKPLSDYLYVATISLRGALAYGDSVPMKKLGFPLETQKVHMPPENLRNMTSITGVVRLAGSFHNKIYLSEVFQPYNWPVKYELTLDHTIIHMKELDRRLYVTTDAEPYIVDVSDCDDAKCIPVQGLFVPLPDISYHHAGSAIMTQHGLVYSTPIGVVLLDSGARWHCLTSAWFGEDEWVKLRPDTARFAYWEGYLFIVTDVASFILDIDGDPYKDMKEGELVTISDEPLSMLSGHSGQLLFLEKNGDVTQWNAGASLRPFLWESRQLTSATHKLSAKATVGSAVSARSTGVMNQNDDPPLGNLWSPASAKIRTLETKFTLRAHGSTHTFVRSVIDEKPFRIPRMGRHLWYKAQFEGTEPVEFFTMGTSHFTVAQGI